MKKYLGQIIFNLVMAGIAAYVFGKSPIADSLFLSIGAIILMMAVLCGGNYIFVQTDGKKITQKSYIITENTFEKLETPQDYLDVMKEISDYDICRTEANKILEQWETFRKKSETLNTICSGGGVYDVVNHDVEEVMLKNMMLFIKRTAIIQSASKNEKISLHMAYLNAIIERNNRILNDYTKLLVEVSQMTDGDSENTGLESLEMLIDSIKNCRQELN